MVSPDISNEDLATEYKKIVKYYHPVLQTNADPEVIDLVNQITICLNNAWGKVKRPDLRADYDRSRGNNRHLDTSLKEDIVIDPLARDGKDSYEERRISFANSLKAVRMRLTFTVREYCTSCIAKGKIIPDGAVLCDTCNGTRKITKVITNFIGKQSTQTLDCPDCRGEASPEIECDDCEGRGFNNASKTVEVDVPPGLTNGKRVHYTGLGNPGFLGGKDGDLYLVYLIEEDENYKRDGFNIRGDINVTLSTLLSGDRRIIETPRGKVRITIPPNTPPNTEIKLAGVGVPKGDSNTFGDLIITIRLIIPTDLTDEKLTTLQELGL